MHIVYKMKERILEFLKAENKSSAQFAEEIGVQPSGISHILSGRNNPSLDFVMKMLEKYPDLSTEWLLFGKGLMYRNNRERNLFDDNYIAQEIDFNKPVRELKDEAEKIKETDLPTPFARNNSPVVKIVWFYDDKSFEEYFPRS